MAGRVVERGDAEALVARAQRGDREAFGALVRIHQHEVFTLALRLVSDPELASDVAQEAFVRAWRALPRFRGEAAFSTWMHRITVNVAWTLRKRRKRLQGSPLDEAGGLPDPNEQRDPERMGENLELRAKLREALGELPRSQRAVVVLKDVEGWSHAEVAAALGISVTAAKVRLHRARRRLQELLRKERTWR